MFEIHFEVISVTVNENPWVSSSRKNLKEIYVGEQSFLITQKRTMIPNR